MVSNRMKGLLSALTLLASIGCDPGMPGGGGPQPGELGAICARNADCDSGLCLAAGRCTIACASGTDCPSAWSCDGLPGTGLICQCTATSTIEECNGLDDECNGRIDDGATCPAGLTCEGGECLCPVEERCDGECPDLGSDPRHCGACGNACGEGQVCEAGACVVSCSDTTTRCGDACVDLSASDQHCGSCGNDCGVGGDCVFGSCECSGELMPCTGSGCVDPATDRMNCGGCGNACGAGELCRDGSCECSPGFSRCGTACVDVTTDEANCGGCGVACGAGATCEAGACVAGCVAPEVRCGDACVDPRTDAANCGTCGNTCEGGEVCVASTCQRDCGALTRCGTSCTDLSADPANCGSCGTACGAGTSCRAGSCVAAVPVGIACSSDSTCRPSSGGVCLGSFAGFPGGYCSQSCDTMDCPSGSLCRDSSIGAYCMQACDAESDCRSGYGCYGGFADFVCLPDDSGTGMCTDTCRYAGDGECDDGGPGATTTACALGTDCTDCGPR